MLSRRNRLSRPLLTEALKAGKRRSSAHFSVVLPPSGVQGFAVIIPKKVARLSVTRHRIKRRVMAALESFKAPAAIIFPKAEVKDMEYSEVQTELKKLLS